MMNCPDCGNRIVQRSAEKLCSKCGLVLEEDYFNGTGLLV